MSRSNPKYQSLKVGERVIFTANEHDPWTGSWTEVIKEGSVTYTGRSAYVSVAGDDGQVYYPHKGNVYRLTLEAIAAIEKEAEQKTFYRKVQAEQQAASLAVHKKYEAELKMRQSEVDTLKSLIPERDRF